MARFEVKMTLVRSVVVEVEARDYEDAKDAALQRSRWLRSSGGRSRLKLLCFGGVERVDAAR